MSGKKTGTSRWVGYVLAAVMGTALLAKLFGYKNLNAVLMSAIIVGGIVALFSWFLKDRMSKVHRVRYLFGQVCGIHDQLQEIGHIPKEQVEEFSRLADECLSLINSQDDDYWTETLPRQSDIPGMRNRIQQMSLLVLSKAANQAVPMSEEIERLAILRKEGMISDHEFQAFSERFRMSTGEKARDIIKAISALHSQYATGALLSPAKVM